MKIELKINYDTDNTYISESLQITYGFKDGTVSLKLSASDREIHVNCQELRRALRGLQTWEEEAMKGAC